MVVGQLCERAVAIFHRRGGPLEGPGMCTLPTFSSPLVLGCQMPGARVPLTGLVNRLEHESDLGFVHWTARACELCLPVHQ